MASGASIEREARTTILSILPDHLASASGATRSPKSCFRLQSSSKPKPHLAAPGQRAGPRQNAVTPLSPSPPLKVRHSRGDPADNHKTTLQGRRRPEIGTTRLEKGRSSKVSRFYLSVSYVPDWAWKSPQPITTRYRQRIQEKEKEACSLWQRSWDGRRPARSWQGNPYPVAQSAHSSTTWAGQPLPTS